MTNGIRRPASTGTAAWLAVALLAPISAQEPPQPAMARDLSREIACSPQASILPPAPSLRVLGGQDERKALFGIAESVVLGSGSAQGLRVGQEYFVRRVVHDQLAEPVSGYTPVSIHTAAWVRVLEVQANTAIATITDACDGVMTGDYLDPFVRPVVPVAAAAGAPDYAAAGVIVLGDERRQMGATGDRMVVDRGSYHGVRPGQRVTIFRVTVDRTGPVVRVGEATALVVDRDTSLIRIDRSRDAIRVGDQVALHK